MTFRLRPLHEDKLHFADLSNTQILILALEAAQKLEWKCSIEKMPVDFPVAPASVQELIEAVVSWQVSEYNERLLQSEMLKYLTREEMEDKAAAGKVDFGANYNGKPAAEAEAIINALQSYEDGIFRIFLNDAELGELSSPIQLKEESTLTFIRLAMLSGRLW